MLSNVTRFADSAAVAAQLWNMYLVMMFSCVFFQRTWKLYSTLLLPLSFSFYTSILSSTAGSKETFVQLCCCLTFPFGKKGVRLQVKKPLYSSLHPNGAHILTEYSENLWKKMWINWCFHQLLLHLSQNGKPCWKHDGNMAFLFVSSTNLMKVKVSYKSHASYRLRHNLFAKSVSMAFIRILFSSTHRPLLPQTSVQTLLKISHQDLLCAYCKCT